MIVQLLPIDPSPPASNQEAYDRIRAAFTAPGAPADLSRDDSNNVACVYRTEDGNGCALGRILPDELIHEEWNNNSISYVFGYDPDECQPVIDFFAEVDLAFLTAAQDAHDESGSLENFIDRLDDAAARFSLRVPS